MPLATGPWALATVLVGSARVDITPQKRFTMGGYVSRIEKATGTMHPLFARVFVLSPDPLLIVVLDFFAVPLSWSVAVRGHLENTFGLSSQRIILIATHSHSAVNTLDGGEEYLQEVESKLVPAVGECLNGMRKARTAFGTARVPGVAGNRQDPAQPVDDRVWLLSFEHQGIFAVFPCHPTVLGADNLSYSGDLHGVSALIAEESFPMVAVANGAGGNVSTRFTRKAQSRAELQRLASRLAAGIQSAAQNLNPLDIDSVQAASVSVALPMKEKIARAELINRIRDTENLMESLTLEHGQQRRLITRVEGLRGLLDEEGKDFSPDVEFTVVSLGGKVLLVAVPLELFPETQQLLSDSFPNKEVLLLCYANNYQGYLVPKARINQEYESLVSPYAAEAEDILVTAIVSTAHQILHVEL